LSGSTSPPAISVVVAARDDERALADCLASLAAVDYPPERLELVVVDNGSRDRTLDVVESFPVRALEEPRRGVCFARNAGLGAASGEVVAFTDPDCAVTTSWLREIAKPFADPAVGAVAGAILPYPPRTLAELYAARRMSHSQLRCLPHRYAMTPNLAVRRAALERVGGFDPAMPGGGYEDADLCWRLQQETRLELRYAPRAVVLHRYRSTPCEFLVQHHRYGRGLALLRRRFPSRLPWGARERGRAYGGLVRAVGRLVATAVRRGGRVELGLAWYDLLRHLGQRSGFLRGSLASRAIGGRA
jgi:cellulose synthase/poly-beta-1,6-N-acetylglucosamine synthase-like glycosyltransferase